MSHPEARLQELLPILRCPATGQNLRLVADHLETFDGTTTYVVRGGVPVLIDADRSLFSRDVPSLAGRRPRVVVRLRRWVDAHTPSLSANVASARNFERIAMLIRETEPAGVHRVLVVGGGDEGAGMAVLLGDEMLDVVNTDVGLSQSTDVICDAHDLPFASESFDAVVCQAVLEHVADPACVVAEVHRVLRHDGIVYSEIPFMQQVHAGPYDFTRVTLVGHQRLFRRFSEIDSGVTGGPGMALAWSILYFMLAVVGRSRLARVAVQLAVRTAFFWLKYVDKALADTPGGVDAAAGTFFIGRKDEKARSDVEIVAAYRGAQRTDLYG